MGTPKRAWRTTLAGTADDPAKTAGQTTLAGTADNSGGDGGRLWRGLGVWRGRRTTRGRRPTLAWRGRRTNLADDPGGDGERLAVTWRTTLLASSRRVWRQRWTTAGRKDLGGRLDDRHSWPGSGTDSGRLWHGRRMTADDSERAGDPGELVGEPGGACWTSSGDSMQRLWRGTNLLGLQKSLQRLWRGRRDDPGGDGDGTWRRTLVGDSARLCHSQKELGGLWRGRLDGRLWRWPARTGEDVAATATHHSDVPVTLPNIATSVRLVQHGEGEEAEHKTRSSPASGGCGWVPRYEDGATHDHLIHGWGAPWHCDTPKTPNPKP